MGRDRRRKDAGPQRAQSAAVARVVHRERGGGVGRADRDRQHRRHDLCLSRRRRAVAQVDVVARRADIVDKSDHDQAAAARLGASAAANDAVGGSPEWRRNSLRRRAHGDPDDAPPCPHQRRTDRRLAAARAAGFRRLAGRDGRRALSQRTSGVCRSCRQGVAAQRGLAARRLGFQESRRRQKRNRRHADPSGKLEPAGRRGQSQRADGANDGDDRRRGQDLGRRAHGGSDSDHAVDAAATVADARRPRRGDGRRGLQRGFAAVQCRRERARAGLARGTQSARGPDLRRSRLRPQPDIGQAELEPGTSPSKSWRRTRPGSPPG